MLHIYIYDISSLRVKLVHVLEMTRVITEPPDRHLNSVEYSQYADRKKCVLLVTKVYLHPKLQATTRTIKVFSLANKPQIIMT